MRLPCPWHVLWTKHAVRLAPLLPKESCCPNGSSVSCVHCSIPFASEHSAVQSFCRSRHELSRRSETMQINHFMCQKYSSLLTDTFLLLDCLYAAPTPNMPSIGTTLLKQYCFPIFVGSQFRPIRSILSASAHEFTMEEHFLVEN